jgi:diguanylate cyclase (GGDEF)-like protein
MTTANKINTLFLFTAILLGSVVMCFTAQSEYQGNLERLVDSSVADVLGRPDLQLHIYLRDDDKLTPFLGELSGRDAIAFASAHDSLGEVLAGPLPAPSANIVDIQTWDILRSGFSVTETGLAIQDATSISLWSSLGGNRSPIRLTIPVLTAVDPTLEGLRAADFGRAIMAPNANGSLVVIGYLQLGLDREALFDSIVPAVSWLFSLCLIIIALSFLPVFYLTQRIARPLAQLAQLADDVASGKRQEHVKIEGGREFREIANLINAVVGGVESYKQEIGIDQQLLALKVDESASKLSQRNKELNRAAEEITETRSQLRQMAYYDTLTSLPNRRLFTEQLSLLLRLAERDNKLVALMFLDLDNFKRINDSLGHSAGDRILREIGKRLTDCLRESDLLSYYSESESGIEVARLGGDEFTIVLNQLDNIESAGLVALRVIDTLTQPISIDDHEVVVTPSIGIAVAPDHGSDVEELLGAAATATYHAKTVAGEAFLFYDEEMSSADFNHLKLESGLRKAIERGELVLHYQPQVNTVDGKVVGAEALLRWEHPEFGEVPPSKFIPLAEEIGLIAELGDWVLVEACRQMNEFRDQGITLPRVAVNISPFQFSSRFIQRVKEVLQETGLPAAMLELGLSEGILMNNDSRTVQALQELREMGVYLSVDDFGTSPAPLGYLSRNPMDELKIDRSFVLDCDTREESAKLVLAIIAMASSLELNLVAEGVETESQCNFLYQNGARVIQGYLFSKPVPAAQLKPLLAPWHFMEQVQGYSAETPAPEPVLEG